MKEKTPLTVGQVLYFVPNPYIRRGAEPFEVTVTKVGRKWVHVGEGWQAMRLDPVTMCIDGGAYSSPGSCYLSREEYEQSLAVEKEWRNMHQRMSHQPPHGVTLEAIQEAKRLLGLDR